MLDAAGIRDCYVAMGQLVARAAEPGFGNAAAGFLATVTDAARVQYWELSAQSDAFVLLGDAQFGDSLNRATNHRISLRRDGRALCPFDVVAINGDLLEVAVGSAFDLSRVTLSYGPIATDPLYILPLKSEAGNLFGCMVFGDLPSPDILTTTEVRIACLTVVRLGQRAREGARLKRVNVELSASLRRFDSEKREQRQAVDRTLTHALPGRSPEMRRVRNRVQQLARSSGPVLITTPAGDSAEPVARELHRLSNRASEPFLIVPAVTLLGDSLSVGLFGHMRGAVPGVSAARRGALREAGRGMVLMDRIEDLDQPGQEQVLRLLQNGTYRPFGSSRDLPLQARIAISLRQETLWEGSEARVLPTLYYELKPGEIALPALSGTPEDGLDLLRAQMESAGFDVAEIAHCLTDSQLDRKLRRSTADHGRDSMAALIRSALRIAGDAGETISAAHFLAAEATPRPDKRSGNAEALPVRMAEFEAELIADALARFDGRRADAARFLSIPKRTLADKCLRYGL